MMLQDEILAILSNTSLTQAEQATLLSALVTPVAVTPAPQALTVAAPPSVGGVAVRIDPVVPAGSPNTITMEVTGHVLSLPLPSQGEGLLGYFQRTSLQTGGNAADAGGLMVTAGAYADKFQMDVGNANSWPYVCDYYANTVAYMNHFNPGSVSVTPPPGPPVITDGFAQAGVAQGPVPFSQAVSPVSGLSMQDLLYIVSQTNAIPGGAQTVLSELAPTATPDQIKAAINIIDEGYPGELGNPPAYTGVAVGAVTVLKAKQPVNPNPK